MRERIMTRDLAKMYEFSYGAIKRNLDGLSNEEEPGSSHQRQLCELGAGTRRHAQLDSASWPAAIPCWQEKEGCALPSRQCSHPCRRTGVLDLATLRGLLDDSQQQLIPSAGGDVG